MSFTPSVAEELLGSMQGLGHVSTKPMFGACAFYLGPSLFGCLFEGDIFYLKATGDLAEELKALGSQPFNYQSKFGKSVVMPYWTAPPACLEEADEMVKWARKSLAAIASKPPKKRDHARVSWTRLAGAL